MAAKPLTIEQLAAVLYKAGFRGETLVTMVALAYPESGARPDAYNGNTKTGDQSYGLWQINMLGSMGPARRKQFGLQSNEDLFDPLTNAKAAYEIHRSQGLGAWGAYRHGRHKAYLDEARKAVANLDPNVSVPTRQGTPTKDTDLYGRSKGDPNYGADENAEEVFPDLEDNENDESIINLPSSEEIRDLFLELFGREPSSEEIAELRGQTLQQDRKVMLKDEEALDYSLAQGAMGIRRTFSGN